MIPIQRVFHDFRTFDQYRRNCFISASYERVIYSLDYSIHVYRDFGDPSRGAGHEWVTRDDGHGQVYTLLSRRNQRDWGYFTSRRGCQSGCDGYFHSLQTWEELDRVRDRIANDIIWRSGEATLDAFQETFESFDHERHQLRKLDYKEFLGAANAFMI